MLTKGAQSPHTLTHATQQPAHTRRTLQCNADRTTGWCTRHRVKLTLHLAINAECAALLSPAFSNKLTAARRDHLQLLVIQFLENRPGQVWPVMHNEVKSLRRQAGLRDIRNATGLGSQGRSRSTHTSVSCVCGCVCVGVRTPPRLSDRRRRLHRVRGPLLVAAVGFGVGRQSRGQGQGARRRQGQHTLARWRRSRGACRHTQIP